jgi:hypothetical protein
MNIPHPFLDLELTDRSQWVTSFCARRLVEPLVGPQFPALVRGQSPSDWLVNQFQRLALLPGLRDRLRLTIAELISTHGGYFAAGNERDQVIGTLLDAAGQLDFIEIAPHLADWVRSGWIDEGHVYIIGNAEIPLRRTVWELLIGWNQLDGLGPQLTRDLQRLAKEGESGTAQLCFVALGQRHPSAALEMIPHTVTLWHEAYWVSAVTRFMSSVGRVSLLRQEYKNAWSTCLGRCFYDYDNSIQRFLREPPQLAEFDSRRPNRLYTILEELGITIQLGSTSVLLQNPEGDRLLVDVQEYSNSIEKWTIIPAGHSRSLVEIAA